MAILVLVIPFVAFSVIISAGRVPWRESVLTAAVLWGLLLTIITEALSVFEALSYPWLLGAWLVIGTVLVGVSVRVVRKRVDTPKRAVAARDVSLWSLVPIGAVVAVTGLIAFVAPPNNWDSHTYHMGRVAHWIQNQGVQHYPTGIARQLFSAPWAEFAVTHVYLLNGTDRLVNGLQWLSMVGSLLGVSLIAKQLGGNAKSQAIAALVAAMLPMGILQASSTQNDYVVSFWLVCVAYYTLLLLDAPGDPGVRRPLAVLIGLSSGLAILTKATAYFYATGFLAWLALVGFRRWGRRSVGLLVGIGMIVLAMNSGHYVRNVEVFGSPLASLVSKQTYSVSTPDPGLFVSNVLKNLVWDVATPFPVVNRTLEAGLVRVHDAVGIDLNDERVSLQGKAFQLMTDQSNEDFAAYPIHLFLVGLCVVWLAVTGRRPNRSRMPYMAALLVGYVLFCLLVKWAPYNSRLHLPFFVLSSAPIAVMLSETERAAFRTAVLALLVLTSPYYLLLNHSRPLIGSRSVILGTPSILSAPRHEQYFTPGPDRFAPYKQAAELLTANGCSQVGLWLSDFRNGDEDAWEYPLWVLLGFGEKAQLRIEHVNIRNESVKLSSLDRFRSFEPCGIVAVYDYGSRARPDRITQGERTYEKIWTERTVAVYRPGGDPLVREVSAR